MKARVDSRRFHMGSFDGFKECVCKVGCERYMIQEWWVGASGAKVAFSYGKGVLGVCEE